MSKLTKKAVERVLTIIRNEDEEVSHRESAIDFGDRNFLVHCDGRVYLYGICADLPSDWNDRRRIARAARRRHRALTDELIRLGKQAKRDAPALDRAWMEKRGGQQP